MTLTRMARMRTMAILAAALVHVTPATAETFVGTNVDSRVVVALKADDAAVQALLPDGWSQLTLPEGPLKGANLLAVFIDRHLQRDPEGKPSSPATARAVALVAYGVSSDAPAPRMFVARVYETAPVANSYGNGVESQVGHDVTQVGPPDAPATRTERWELQVADGGAISLSLTHQVGTPGWSHAEALPYSAANPGFHRIYRYDQLAELVMSRGLGRDLQGEVSFGAKLADLPDLFDGGEEVIAILSVPVYVRDVFLP